MILKSLRDWILLLLPLVAIFTTSSFCKIGENSGKNVKFRPPAAVFGITWFCLMCMFGLSWVISVQHIEKNGTIYEEYTAYGVYTLLLVSLMLWIILYGCAKSKLKALWTLIPSLMFCFMAQSIGNYVSKILIAPLIAWLIFATIMATQEYQSD